MEIMASRRSNSLISQSTAASSSRRQEAFWANNCNTSRSNFESKRLHSTTRPSLSRSFDSREGLQRISQASPQKLNPKAQWRSSTPRASASMRSTCASTRNQTILDDVAWMTARIQNFQNTDFLRYPSKSKLRDISSHVQSLPAKNANCQELSSLSSSFNENCSTGQTQTAVDLEDEPLSAFKLSEVSISEEDLLTNSSLACYFAPLTQQTGFIINRTGAEQFLDSSCLDQEQKNHSDLTSQQPTAFSEKSSLSIRSDLLLRLEALQHRAESTARAIHSSKIDSVLENQNLKDSWRDQALPCHQDFLPSSHGHQKSPSRSSSFIFAAATPNQAILKPIAVQTEQEKNPPSNCWPVEGTKTALLVSPPLYSPKKASRAEYYLPLYKDETSQKNMSSPDNEKGLTPKNENFNRRAGLQSSSPSCPGKAECESPWKCSSSRKELQPLRKSKKTSERLNFTDKPSRANPATFVSGASVDESCVPVRKAPLGEERSSQTSFCPVDDNFTDFLREQDGSDMNIFRGEEDHHIESDLKSFANHRSSQASWISEENVEGFLSSRCFEVDCSDSLNYSNRLSYTNGCSIDQEKTLLFPNFSRMHTVDKKKLPLSPGKQSCLSKPARRNGPVLCESLTACEFKKEPRVVSFSEERQDLDCDVTLRCKTVQESPDVKGFLEDADTIEQPSREGKHSCCNADNLNNLNKSSSKAHDADPSNQQPVHNIKMPGKIQPDRNISNNSTREFCFGVNLGESSVDERFEKGSFSHSLAGKTPASPTFRDFTKISCCLNFDTNTISKPQTISSQNMCLHVNKPKAASVTNSCIHKNASCSDSTALLSNTSGLRALNEVSLSRKTKAETLQQTGTFGEQEILKRVLCTVDEDNEHKKASTTTSVSDVAYLDASKTNEMLFSSAKLCPSDQFQPEDSREAIYVLQDGSKIDKIVEGTDNVQHLLVRRDLFEYTENLADNTVASFQKSQKKEEAADPNSVKDRDQSGLIEHNKAVLSEQQVSKDSVNLWSHTNFSADTIDNSAETEISCSPRLWHAENLSLTSERVIRMPSMLSVYKNPLWLDDNNSDLGSCDTIDQYKSEFPYCGDITLGFINSQSSRENSSERAEQPTWDQILYNCINTNLHPYPIPPASRNKKESLEALDKHCYQVNFKALDASMDTENKSQKKLETVCEKVEDKTTFLHRIHSSESCTIPRDSVYDDPSESAEKDNIISSFQTDHQQLSGSCPQIMLKSHLSSSPVNDSGVADDNCQSLVHSEQCMQVKIIPTTRIEFSSGNTQRPEDYSGKHFLLQSPYLVGRDDKTKHYDVPLINSTKAKEENLFISKKQYQTDTVKAGEATMTCNSRTEESIKQHPAWIQESGAEHVDLANRKFLPVTGTNENQLATGPTMKPTDEFEANEEVKMVAFVYSDSKDPSQKVLSAAQKESFVSTSPWSLLLMQRNVQFKRRKQKQSLEQRQEQTDQKNLRRLGEKVEALEAQVDKLKREKKKLQNLLKDIIRKLQQFQEGFCCAKKRRSSSGFMTCLYSVHVKTCKYAYPT